MGPPTSSPTPCRKEYIIQVAAKDNEIGTWSDWSVAVHATPWTEEPKHLTTEAQGAGSMTQKNKADESSESQASPDPPSSALTHPPQPALDGAKDFSMPDEMAGGT
ncbi:hypothetical protein E2320_017913 [Naja naja]|nr:hypothetical protein E2320_017913 [Naja naja]